MTPQAPVVNAIPVAAPNGGEPLARGHATTINWTYTGTPGTTRNTPRADTHGGARTNANLDDTVRLARAIKTDTGNILSGARTADRSLDCIENGLLTGAGSVPGPVPC